MPVFDMLETAMVKRLNFPPGIALRILVRSAYVGENQSSYIPIHTAQFWWTKSHTFLLINFLYVTLIIAAFTLFVGVTFPFFGDLLGFFGGFGFAPTSYFVSQLTLIS